MIRWTVLLLTLSAAVARAEDDNKHFELRLRDPAVGYSNYSGLILHHGLDLAFDLSSRWQWQVGGTFHLVDKGKDRFKLETGPRYNFSDDRERSWYLGVAAVFTDYRDPAAKIEVGRRFKLGAGWTWDPHVSVEGNGDYSRTNIQPASFTFRF